MMIMNFFDGKKEEMRGEVQYLVIGLPRELKKKENRMEEIKGYQLIYHNTDLDYAVMKRMKGDIKDMKEQKYLVKELPNNTQKIQILLNELNEDGYSVLFMNDYSVTFVKESME